MDREVNVSLNLTMCIEIRVWVLKLSWRRTWHNCLVGLGNGTRKVQTLFICNICHVPGRWRFDPILNKFLAPDWTSFRKELARWPDPSADAFVINSIPQGQLQLLACDDPPQAAQFPVLAISFVFQIPDAFYQCAALPHVVPQVPPFWVMIFLSLVDVDFIFLSNPYVNLILNGERYTALLSLWLRPNCYTLEQQEWTRQFSLLQSLTIFQVSYRQHPDLQSRTILPSHFKGCWICPAMLPRS